MTKRRKHFSRADKHSLFLLVTLFWKKKKKFTCFHTWKIILNNPFFFKSFFSCVTSRDKKKKYSRKKKNIIFVQFHTWKIYFVLWEKIMKRFYTWNSTEKRKSYLFLYAWNQVKEKCLIWFHTFHQPWSLLISWSLALHNNSVGCGNVAADYIRLHLDVMDVR